MNKLDLCPLQSSYSVKYGTSVERITLRGGFGRYVQTKNAKKHLVDVAFTLREDDFIYFRAFYLNWQLNPLPFLMSLIIEDSEFREYIAQFVPDSFSFNELSGKIFKVSAQLVVVTSEVQILTSKPYPLFFYDSIKSSALPVNPRTFDPVLSNENLLTNFSVKNAKYLSEITYTTLPYEPVDQVKSDFSVRNAKYLSEITYTTLPYEPIDQIKSAFSVKNAVIKDVLITHETNADLMQSEFIVLSAKYIEEI
ncbi:hypothetical protein [Acinetobacter haemolyticus]|uniref:hypothetical protein n=1 Tax=Acinetobacter haemolyticus TaxID=29430 RepID=UPI000DEB3319|nr:hypothetical protein [Acinetobacter haemolyticus]WHR57581.1 hypothetical protein PGW89_14360 [Acinetobacter haemolyticus]